MGGRTLVQQKERPIHRIRPGKSVVAHTYCGVDPYRRGVRTERVNVGQLAATCRECLRLEGLEVPKEKQRMFMVRTNDGRAVLAVGDTLEVGKGRAVEFASIEQA